MPFTKIIVILIFGLLAIPLWAQPGSTTIIADADEMIKDTPSQTLTLKGSVNVIFQQQHLVRRKQTWKSLDLESHVRDRSYT